ncbi:deaminase [Thalassospira lucentensis]|uniref:tRNA-specific adenosine deaminase n=1 Tax=Thalassospira lucentensis TaxID=168935 RepID=A0A358HR46_9PROT|nr:nucleoside deaminase [Thalassospira lucentensis]HBU97659.1 tRNA-specific adenosine deaminase [Thalassospira lucentensis]HCW67137.1 tRNA-specific adenosine deaminase [Thalassospira lucentensis]
MSHGTLQTELLDTLFSVLENDVLPKTRSGVAAGNKVFGAAILRKSDHALVIAETNNEMENPLWHGEVHCLKRFYEMPADQRPVTSDLIFLSTHEPCSMCLSAITWAGFDNFYYFFSYEDSRDAFAIPHDLKIMQEVFTLKDGEYNKSNAFWDSHSMMGMIAELPKDQQGAYIARAQAISDQYDQLSTQYQDTKSDNDIPLN